MNPKPQPSPLAGLAIAAIAVLLSPVINVANAQVTYLIDFAGDGANSSGVSPDPWISINSLEQDEEVDLGLGVTLTALDDGFSPNNPAPPGEEAEYDGVPVPVEARDDYLFKTVDAAGTEARMRIDGLPAGTYNVTVFEGRTSDPDQFAKIWVGKEPDDENTGNFAGESATVEVTIGAGDILWYKHLEDNTGGISGMIIRQTGAAGPLDPVLIDFAGDGANSSGVSPDPWISINSLEEDEVVDLGGGITLTALDDGFSPNNPAPPGEEAEYDGVPVPLEARDDYLFKTVDAAGTEARMRIDGLPAGTYNVTVFEGRTSDPDQFAKIWVGEEPNDENTGNFAGDSATVEVTVAAGDILWYKHLEDNTGGISGMIIRQTSAAGGANPLVVTRVRSSLESLSFEFRESDEGMLDRDSVKLTVDGVGVTPIITDSEGGVSVVYLPPAKWDPGSTHTYDLVAKDTEGKDAIRSGSGEFELRAARMPFNTPLVGPEGVDGMWGVRYIWDAGTIGINDDAIAAIQASDSPDFEGQVFDTTMEVVNHGTGVHLFPEDLPYPEEVEFDEEGLWTGEDFVVSYKGTLKIVEAGKYTFGVHSDDGFGLRIFGAEFIDEAGAALIDSVSLDTYVHPAPTGDSNSRAIANFPTAGNYPIEFFWYERGGGDHGELFFAKGEFLDEFDTDIGDAEDGKWELVGTDHLVGAAGLPFQIVNLTKTGNSAAITWQSKQDVEYTIEKSTGLQDFVELTDGILSAGETTTFTDEEATESDAYYRVREDG